MGSIVGTVASTTGATPLANVAITVSPGTLTATTATDGTFTLKDVPVGSYTLTFKRSGYADKTIAGVSVAMAGPTNMAVAMDTGAAGGGPTIVVGDNLIAGFNQSVSITATVTPGSDETGGSLTYAWAQTGGAPATLTGGTTNAITFTTQTIAAAKPTLVPRFGPLGWNPDEIGNYAFTLTVTDPQGHKTSATVHVDSTAPRGGIANGAMGIPVWMQGDAKNAAGTARTAWSWTIDGTNAQGSTATLIDPATNAACANPCTTQFPSFTPDKLGYYTVTETDSTTTPATVKSVKVYAGTWLGIMDSSTSQQQTCMGCHNDQPLPGGTVPIPDKFTPWKNTAHYSALKRKLDGEATSHFSNSCMECHSVGNSALANNGGFDDVAKTAGYSFPATLVPGNYKNLVDNYPSVAQLGSIQCESCHGPQNSAAHPSDKNARISFATDVCASCHQENPTHYKPSQWSTSKHADVTLPPRVATIESKATAAGGPTDAAGGAQHCARCHSAQGFARYAKQLGNGANGRYDFITTDNKKLSGTNAPTVQFLTDLGLTNAEVEPQTCTTCHDPHANPTPVANIDCSLQANNGDAACAQLRVFDAINGLPNGQGPIAGVGSGAICMTCHNSRNGEHSDYQPSAPPYTETPHDGTVTDVVFGFNAYFMPRYTSSQHLAIQDTCAGCHYGVPTADQVGNHQTSNHSFMADLTICSSCHGTAGVDGAALLAQQATQLAALDAAIDAHVKQVIYAQSSALTVQVSGVKCTPADKVAVTCQSSIVPSQVPPLNPPSTVVLPVLTAANSTITRSGTTLTIQLLPATGGPTVNVDYYDPRFPANYPGSKLGTTALSKLSVPLRGIMLNGSYMFGPSSYTAKAIWNTTLLKNDGAASIHNLPFTNGVIGNTNSALNNNPNAP